MKNGLSMKLMSITTVVLLSTFLSPSDSFAAGYCNNGDDDNSAPYISFHGGIHSPGKLTDSNVVTFSAPFLELKEEQEFNNLDGTGGIAFGRDANTFRYELEIIGLRASIDKITLSSPGIPDMVMGPADGTTTIIGGMFNFLFQLRPSSFRTTNFYAGVGLGYGQVNSDIDLDLTSANPGVPTVVSSSRKDKAFLYQFIAGMMYNYSDDTSLFFDFRHIGTGEYKHASGVSGLFSVEDLTISYKDYFCTNSFNIGVTRFFG